MRILVDLNLRPGATRRSTIGQLVTRAQEVAGCDAGLHAIVIIDKLNDGGEDRVLIRETVIHTLEPGVLIEFDSDNCVVIVPLLEVHFTEAFSQSFNH